MNENCITKDAKEINEKEKVRVIVVNGCSVPVGDYALLEDDQRDRAQFEKYFNAFGWPKMGIDKY